VLGCAYPMARQQTKVTAVGREMQTFFEKLLRDEIWQVKFRIQWQEGTLHPSIVKMVFEGAGVRTSMPTEHDVRFPDGLDPKNISELSDTQLSQVAAELQEQFRQLAETKSETVN
jgi:hypothetical protein